MVGLETRWCVRLERLLFQWTSTMKIEISGHYSISYRIQLVLAMIELLNCFFGIKQSLTQGDVSDDKIISHRYIICNQWVTFISILLLKITLNTVDAHFFVWSTKPPIGHQSLKCEDRCKLNTICNFNGTDILKMWTW